jgi:hypothetical protein
MDYHESPLSPDPRPVSSPIDKHDFPPELREAQNGTLLLDPDSGMGVIMLYCALSADTTDTVMEWARPILGFYVSGLAQPPTYMELLSGRDVSIWAHFTLDEEWQKFAFSIASETCAGELAIAGEVPVTGHRWRHAPLQLVPFNGAIERTLEMAADLANKHPLAPELVAVSTNGDAQPPLQTIVPHKMKTIRYIIAALAELLLLVTGFCDLSSWALKCINSVITTRMASAR